MPIFFQLVDFRFKMGPKNQFLIDFLMISHFKWPSDSEKIKNLEKKIDRYTEV